MDYIQRGKGYGKSLHTTPVRTKTIQLVNTLIQYGWREDYIRHEFRLIHDSLLANWSTTGFIEEFFGYMIRQQKSHYSIKESLIRIGLREDVAIHMDTILKPLNDSSYTHEQVLDKAIEYLIGRYAPTTSADTLYPFQSNYINTWREHVYRIEDEMTYKVYKLPIYNVSYSCDDPLAKQQCRSALSTLQLPPTHSFFFHATSWDYVLSILNRINRQTGRQCLDFGLYRGFYLSTRVLDSVQWCVKNNSCWNNESAILVFSIPKVFPSSVTVKHLEGDEWVYVTRKSRECASSTNELQPIRDYDLIYGNMLSNPKKVRMGEEIPKPHQPPKKQLVGRTDIAERFLRKCLVGCLYFKKHP